MKKLFIILGFLGIFVIGFLFLNKDNLFGDLKKNEKNEKSVFSEELFGKYYREAEKVLKKMTLEEKVGQLFLVRYDKNLAVKYINNYHVGGFILFSKDFQNHNRQSIKEELNHLQVVSKVHLILGVDEEGGIVTRVSRYPNFRNERFLSSQEIYELGGYELLEKTEKEKGELLLSLGLNLNLAPVADVSVDPNDFIYSRSFGKDAVQTAEYIKNMVGYAKEVGISSSLKHFPGYGNNVDTHTGISIDNRSYENFLENDFLPFKSGIEMGVPTILVSHNIINCIDDKYPATLSEKVIGELRNNLGFSGIIITDDLSMGAVSQYVNEGNAATLAVSAGNDMIITSDLEEMYDSILKALEDKSFSEEKIDLAVRRILAWKIAYKI